MPPLLRAALLLLTFLIGVPMAAAAEAAESLREFQKSLYDVSIKIWYDPSFTTLVDRPFEASAPVRTHRVLRTRLSAVDATEYDVYFSEGGSADFGFSFAPAGEDQWIETSAESGSALWGTELTIPGDGTVIVSGHVNSMFAARRMFRLESGRLQEVKQPYLHVGLTAPTLKPLTLHADRERTQPLLTVPAHADVTVVLAEGDLYLIKTSAGLVGWARIPQRQQADTIEGLYFKGD